MTDNNISFKRIKERRVEKVSNVFIERFDLDERKSEITKNILGNKDYIIQTTWLIFPPIDKNE